MGRLFEMNEYGRIKVVAVRTPEQAYRSVKKITEEWQALRFHSPPDLEGAAAEHDVFRSLLSRDGVDVVQLDGSNELTLDSIYTRDALLVSPKGLILCNMGRASRGREPTCNSAQLQALGFEVAGEITHPGTVEGGDVIWLGDNALAVGEGPRTNAEGIRQLMGILGREVEVHVVPLPTPGHPEDVFHLMSVISPLDRDLALVHSPLMPTAFVSWLENRGIQLVEVPEDEFITMGCNVLALGPRDTLMLDRLPKTRARLEAVGCKVQTYRGDEISRKGEGGPTCLTRPLIRGSA